MNKKLQEVLFNGQVVSHYPRDQLVDLRKVQVVVVIADLESRPATLSFKVGDSDLGHALKGLEHIKGPLFPAVSTTGPAASISINYLGGSGEYTFVSTLVTITPQNKL